MYFCIKIKSMFTVIPKELIKRKVQIEREFKSLNQDVAILDVTPVLPDSLDVKLTFKNHRKEKRIHFNESPMLRELFKFHGLL